MPTIELDDGRMLAESNAITWYFADGTPYLPTDSVRAGAGPAVALLRAVPARADARGRPLLDSSPATPSDQALAERQARLTSRSTPWRRISPARDFFVGERYSIADIGLYAYTHVADEGGFDLAAYPPIRAWLERVAAQPGHVSIDA